MDASTSIVFPITEYISSFVIAVLPIDNLKLITTVLAGMTLIPLSLIALFERYSFVSNIYLLVFVKSAIDIHL